MAACLPEFVSRQVAAARRYFLDLAPDRRRPLTVVCGGCETVRRDYVVERADFPYWCVEFVAAGRGVVTLAGRDHPLAAGSVFAYGPGSFGRHCREAERLGLGPQVVDDSVLGTDVDVPEDLAALDGGD